MNLQNRKQTSTTGRRILIHHQKNRKEGRTPNPKFEDEQPVWDEVEPPRDEIRGAAGVPTAGRTGKYRRQTPKTARTRKLQRT